MQGRAEKSRARILHEARIVFARQGFDAANVRDIAAASETRHSMIRYHFGSKEQLWREAVRDMFEVLDKAIDLDAADVPPIDGLEGFKDLLRRYIRHCAANPDHARIMVSEAMIGGERLQWIVDNFLIPRREAIAQRLVRASTLEQLPDLNPLSFLYITTSVCQMPFVLAHEVQALFGIDVRKPEIVDAHIESVLNLFFQYRAD